jgi:hypothetical protein
MLVDSTPVGNLDPLMDVLRPLDNLRVLKADGVSGSIPWTISLFPLLETITVHEGNTTVTNPHCSGDPVACGRGNLKGSLPSEIGKLTNLKSLRFDCNGLNGSVSFLGKLTNLVEAHLFNQNWGGGGFKGPLPQDLAKLTRELQAVLGRFPAPATTRSKPPPFPPLAGAGEALAA